MNALLVLFFVAIIINDYLFREGYFAKIYISLFAGYYVIYLFTSKSSFHSSYKHLLLAIFSQSYDPTVYGKLQFNVENAKKFLEEYEKKTGIKVSWTLFVTKLIGQAISKYPDFNSAIKCGRLIRRDSIDLAVLVNVDTKNLGKKILRDVDKKSLKELNDELYSSAQQLKSGKDKEFNKQVQLMGMLPS